MLSCSGWKSLIVPMTGTVAWSRLCVLEREGRVPHTSTCSRGIPISSQHSLKQNFFIQINIVNENSKVNFENVYFPHFCEKTGLSVFLGILPTTKKRQFSILSNGSRKNTIGEKKVLWNFCCKLMSESTKYFYDARWWALTSMLYLRDWYLFCQSFHLEN